MKRTRFSHIEAYKILRKYAPNITSFHATCVQQDYMRVGFYMKADLCVAEEFWDAMRALRRKRAVAARLARKEKIALGLIEPSRFDLKSASKAQEIQTANMRELLDRAAAGKGNG